MEKEDEAKLIDGEGWPRFGIFPEPVSVVNHWDSRLLSPMGSPRSSLARHFAFKQFEFLGILSPEIVFGCALVDIRYLGTAFFYLYHPSSGTFLHRSLKTPLSLGLTMGPTPGEGTDTFSLFNEGVEMGHVDEGRGQTLNARFKVKGGEVKVDATFREDSPPQEPMSLCTRIGVAGWVYAQKTVGLPVSGTLSWPGGELDLASVGALGLRDWSAGFMRRETWWNWGCFAGRLKDGRVVGVNISCGVNETGFTENCYWVDGVLHKVDTVAFRYDRGDLDKPWSMTSSDGLIELHFEPVGRHKERVNAGLVASNFRQLFGRFRGRLGAGEDAIMVDGLWGFAEDHFARW